MILHIGVQSNFHVVFCIILQCFMILIILYISKTAENYKNVHIYKQKCE